MKRVGLLLTAGPGGGTYHNSQTILDAVATVPGDRYRLVAAYLDPIWLDALEPPIERIALHSSIWNRALNKAWHVTRLPIGVWRRTAAHVDSNIRALIAAHCDIWVCPNHDRYAFRAPVPTLGTVHDLMHRYVPSFPEVTRDGEYERREFHFGETCKWARGVFVDSDVGKRQLVESYGIAGDRVFVLPYIAPRYIRERETDAEDHATTDDDAHYDLPNKFFFYPAQFYRHKNHRALIEAIALMKDTHPDVLFWRVRLSAADMRTSALSSTQRVLATMCASWDTFPTVTWPASIVGRALS
jgi:glycosyltransferase involved in cell wall biosynthesis